MNKKDREEIYLIVAEAFEKVMLPHINGITERLVRIETTQDDHGTRLENIETNQAEQTETLDDHSDRLESIEHKLDSTIARVDTHSRRLKI